MSKNLLKSVLCLTLGAIFALSGTTFADDSFEYHGYMRTGSSFNSKLATPKDSIGANGASAKYRLGNEPGSTYIENSFVKNWKDDDGTFMKYVFMGAWTSNERQNWADDGSLGVIRQSYVQGGGFDFAKDMKVWAGLRYYAREDIHINDFYYRDWTGYGAGFEDISLGFAKFNFAWLTNRGDNMTTNSDGTEEYGNQKVHVFDVQLNEIALPGGSLNLDGAFFYLAYGENETTGAYDDAKNGFFTELSYNMSSFFGMGGFAKVVFQYGKGLGGNSNGLGNIGTGIYNTNPSVKDESRMRGIFFGLMEVSQELAIMPVILYDYYDSGDDQKNTWMSFGARAKYSMHRNFAMQFEVGHDRTIDDDGTTKVKPAVTKITIAPTFTFDTGFWTRPEIRFYATYGFWNTDEGEGVNGALKNDGKNATMFGFQAEAWW
jgi:maltoporin